MDSEIGRLTDIEKRIAVIERWMVDCIKAEVKTTIAVERVQQAINELPKGIFDAIVRTSRS